MNNVIISDTSCLIALYRIDQIDLLQKLFQSSVITDIVKHEYGQDLPEWIRVVEVKNRATLHKLELSLDSGEASAIALSMETPDCTLIMDEKKGRKIAMSLDIKVIGT